jgi:hypothetical protein
MANNMLCRRTKIGVRYSAAEVRFGPVLGPLNANPEPDHRSGSGKEGERWTGPSRTRSQVFSLSSERVRTPERYIEIHKNRKKYVKISM